MKQEVYKVPVDKHTKKYTPNKYCEMTAEELDEVLEKFSKNIMHICSSGREGAMVMWAVFKSRLNGGCYSDMINAYRLLTDDPRSLVDREHELRHLYEEYEELWRIRYFGTVENYHLEKAKKAKENYDRYATVDK